MVLDCVSMFENLLEKWQSRRRTIVISQAETKVARKNSLSANSKKAPEPVESNLVENNENAIPECSETNDQETIQPCAYKLIGETSRNSQNNYESQFEIKLPSLDRPTLATCPSLIYASILLVLLLSLNLSHFADHQALAEIQPVKSIFATSDNPGWRLLGRDFIGRLASRQPTRWAFIPTPSNSVRETQNRRRPVNFITRALNRIGNRIGSRNTIRVHNAFRDLAWRLLSGFSMPTPVIYELRRQHFYPAEEDLMNDSLFNKNTSRTIRSRRLLWPLRNFETTTRSGDDDDDATDNLRRRLRLRLEDLVNLSRRSLFGRVVRLPALFPFKRQEGSQETSSSGKKSEKEAKSNRKSFFRRRRTKENDRQMISIDGKQYYIDDDGALKELNDKSES